MIELVIQAFIQQSAFTQQKLCQVLLNKIIKIEAINNKREKLTHSKRNSAFRFTQLVLQGNAEQGPRGFFKYVRMKRGKDKENLMSQNWNIRGFQITDKQK